MRAVLWSILLIGVLCAGGFSRAAHAAIEHSGDFETGDLSQWPGSSGDPNVFFLCCNHSAEIVTKNPSPRAGRYALKIERRGSDPLIAGKWNRAELSLAGHMWEPLYSERWLGMSIYVPDNFPFASFGGGYHSVMTFHGKGRTGSAFNMELRSNKRWRIGYRTAWPDVPETQQPKTILYDEVNSVQTGQWTDFVFHIIRDPRPTGNGLLHVWKDGVKIVEYDGPVGYNEDPNGYFKMGTYANTTSNNVTRTLYFDEVRFGDEHSSYAEVMPGASPDNAPLPGTPAPPPGNPTPPPPAPPVQPPPLIEPTPTTTPTPPSDLKVTP